MGISLKPLGHRSTLHALWRVLVRFGPLPNLEAPKNMELCKFAKKRRNAYLVQCCSSHLQPIRRKVNSPAGVRMDNFASLTRHWTPQTYLWCWEPCENGRWPLMMVGDHWCDWRWASKHRFAHLGNHPQERGAGNAWNFDVLWVTFTTKAKALVYIYIYECIHIYIYIPIYL